jgi:hypothetical protein
MLPEKHCVPEIPCSSGEEKRTIFQGSLSSKWATRSYGFCNQRILTSSYVQVCPELCPKRGCPFSTLVWKSYLNFSWHHQRNFLFSWHYLPCLYHICLACARDICDSTGGTLGPSLPGKLEDRPVGVPSEWEWEGRAFPSYWKGFPEITSFIYAASSFFNFHFRKAFCIHKSKGSNTMTASCTWYQATVKTNTQQSHFSSPLLWSNATSLYS